MRLALISDVHANLQALEAVLADLRRMAPDQVGFLGDAVGYGANPNEAVEIVSEECEFCIMGNHDACALGQADASQFNAYARSALEFTQRALSPQNRERLTAFEISKKIGQLFFTHATPSQPTGWNYCLSPTQAGKEFAAFDYRVCFIGHSHFPIIFSQNSSDTVRMQQAGSMPLVADRVYLINTGSVGQPRDRDPRACYVLYDTETDELIYRRVEYDILAAQAAMKEHDLPQFLIDRLADGR